MWNDIVVYNYWKKIVYPDYNVEVSSSIEKYQHVFKEIMSTWWNKEEFSKYIDSLLLIESDRIQDWEWRKWFSIDAMADIFMLRDVHREVYWIPKNEIYRNPWLT